VWFGVLNNRSVAVKQIELKKFSEGLKHAQRVTQREFDIVSAVKHENIIKYYGLFYSKAEQQVNIVMELVIGVPITDLVLKQSVLSEPQACYILRYLVVAVEHLHKLLIMHRDLKPDNVLISQDGVIKLIDFGTATFLASDGDEKRRSTVGTPWYCAPEVINSEEYSNRCDVWSIGCFAIEIVSGKPPFDELNDIACLLKMAEGKPPLPTDTSSDCTDFLTHCLNSNWRLRPTTKELLEYPFLQVMDNENRIKEELISIVNEMREEKNQIKSLKQKAKQSIVNIKL